MAEVRAERQRVSKFSDSDEQVRRIGRLSAAAVGYRTGGSRGLSLSWHMGEALMGEMREGVKWDTFDRKMVWEEEKHRDSSAGR